MFGWILGVIAVVIAGAVGLGGLDTVSRDSAVILGGAFAVLFVAALLAVASRGSSEY